MRPKPFSLCLFIIYITTSCLQSQDLEINYEVNPDNSITFYYQKYFPGSCYISLYFPKLENAHNSNFEGVVDANKGRLCLIRPINNNKRISFQYKYQYIKGVPNPKIDSTFIYLLPYKKGSTVTVKSTIPIKKVLFEKIPVINSTGYVFFATEKDTVCAIRKGIVVEIINEHEASNAEDLTFTSILNRVKIEHPDGTEALYQGFKKDQIFVEPGQIVFPNTALGMIEKVDSYSEYKLYLHINYLFDSQKTVGSLHSRDFYKGKSYKSISPLFSTDKGISNLLSNNSYTVDFDEGLLIKEFSRKEKRNFKKGKLIIN